MLERNEVTDRARRQVRRHLRLRRWRLEVRWQGPVPALQGVRQGPAREPCRDRREQAAGRGPGLHQEPAGSCARRRGVKTNSEKIGYQKTGRKPPGRPQAGRQADGAAASGRAPGIVTPHPTHGPLASATPAPACSDYGSAGRTRRAQTDISALLSRRDVLLGCNIWALQNERLGLHRGIGLLAPAALMRPRQRAPRRAACLAIGRALQAGARRGTCGTHAPPSHDPTLAGEPCDPPRREARPDPGRALPPQDFIIADAKDPDMGPSLTSTGPKREPDGSWTRYRTPRRVPGPDPRHRRGRTSSTSC